MKSFWIELIFRKAQIGNYLWNKEMSPGLVSIILNNYYSQRMSGFFYAFFYYSSYIKN